MRVVPHAEKPVKIYLLCGFDELSPNGSSGTWLSFILSQTVFGTLFRANGVARAPFCRCK